VVCCQHQVGAGTIGRTYSSRGGRIVGGGEGMVSRPMWLWRWLDVPPPLLVIFAVASWFQVELPDRYTPRESGHARRNVGGNPRS